MKVGVCGHFGNGHDFFDGQTIKTKIITSQLQKKIGIENVLFLDTYGGKKKLFSHSFGMVKMLYKCENIIILPAQNGLLFFAPLLIILNPIFKRKLHYIVIGGWLPSYLKTKKWLIYVLKKFNYIYVETNTMLEALDNIDIKNTVLLPNTKELKIVDLDSINNSYNEPYLLCTFSRITPQKGIEEIINAVIQINKKYNRTVFELHNYGQIDMNYEKRFKQLIDKAPQFIKYKGIVEFDKSSDVLKKYFALVFPTLFYTEGIPGTIIDAYAAGLPVISSKWESFDDIILDGMTGIGYKFGSYVELVSSLDKICNNPELVNNMRLNCILKAKEYLPDNALMPLIRKINDTE